MPFLRRLILIALGAAMLPSVSVDAQSLSTYGTPGIVELPTAEPLDDAEIALTTSNFGSTLRNTLTFQVLPRVTGSFRYSIIDGFNGAGLNRYDRSFDLQFQLADETALRPAIALGFRDIVGTGIYSSEYLVGTKSVRPNIRLSGGVGWGRLGGRGGITNPLGVFASEFETRPTRTLSGGGRIDAGAWFRGDMAFFGGVSWDVSDQLTLNAEYSSDLYSEEAKRGVQVVDSPWNVGLTYQFGNGIDLSAYVVGLEQAGLQFSYTFNPRHPPFPGGLERAPPPLLPREKVAAESWNLPKTSNSSAQVMAVLEQRLADEGIKLQGYEVSANQATVRIQNTRWDVEAQAAGRTARAMANTLPPEIETFVVVFQENGVPLAKVTTARTDLHDLEYAIDGVSRSLARAAIDNARHSNPNAYLPNAYPGFDLAVTPFLNFSFFDPDSPLRYEFGPELQLGYRPAQGVKLSTRLRYPAIGNLDDATRKSNSVLPRVRSEAFRYARESELEINQLTAEYLFRPGERLFGRMTGGYLEPMFGGVSAELLWHPVDSRLALGVDVNYARQRDFDMQFGFRDYDVFTGHASAYYEMKNGFLAQIDAGRYLAGDWGATFTLTREFNNGFKVGGFFTLTDVPFSQFGEGSFDKGIMVEIPVSWITGKASRSSISNTIRPVLRDGGARLEVPTRLYDITRGSRAQSLEDGWGKYFR